MQEQKCRAYQYVKRYRASFFVGTYNNGGRQLLLGGRPDILRHQDGGRADKPYSTSGHGLSRVYTGHRRAAADRKSEKQSATLWLSGGGGQRGGSGG